MYPKNPQNFLERLKFLTESDRISDVEKWSGIPYSTLNNYAQNTRKFPSAELVIDLAERKGLNIHWLLTGMGPMKPPTNDHQTDGAGRKSGEGEEDTEQEQTPPPAAAPATQESPDE